MVRSLTEDGISSFYPHVTPSMDFINYPEHPIVTANTNEYTYTIKELAYYTVTWSYTIDGGKMWSSDYTLHDKISFTLPAGTYEEGSIIIKNKTIDNISNTPGLYMNKFNNIIKRPGIPTVSFQYKNGIVVSRLGDGAVKWRYSLNSGETWSEYLYKPLIIYPPVGNYVAGSIYIKSYTEDGTSHRNPEINNIFYVAGILFAGTHATIKEQSVVSVTIPFGKTDTETRYDNEKHRINSMINWPSYISSTLSVNIAQSDYTSWEYSLGLNENDVRIWIKGDEASVIIPPGYYTTFSIGIRLKKHHAESGNETIIVFNTREIVIYPRQPQLTYIEKGIFVVKLLDKDSTWEYKLKNVASWTKGYGSTLLLKPDTYNIGEIWVRSVVNNEVMSPFRSNAVPVIVHDNDYHVNEMPYQEWEISTILTTPAYKNDMVLNVVSNYRFGVTKGIIIGYGEESETRIVTGLGSLHIDRPLTRNYPEGTLVRGFDIELIDSLSLAEKAYGIIIKSETKRQNKRIKCMKYITDPENATIETCIVDNQTSHLLGDGKGTKKKRIGDMVRTKNGQNGKIVYGDNGLSSPFLPPDTIEDTPVSIFYRCNVPNDVPIVNGLRGGIVRASMRTNKF
jgi:hypothetical protein